MRWRALRPCLTALVLAGALTLAPVKTTLAQDLAALVANSVRIDAAGQLIAEGGVEVFFQGRTLRATRIVYVRAADRLIITGPMAKTPFWWPIRQIWPPT